MPPKPKPFRVERVGEVHVLDFAEVDLHDALAVDQVQQQLESYIEGEPGLKLVIDLSNVKAVSSAMLGALIIARRAIVAAGGAVRLCSASELVMQPIRMSRLNQIFAIDPDRATAIAAISEPKR